MLENSPYVEELKTKGSFSIFGSGALSSPIYNYPIDAAENLKLRLKGEKPYWMPFTSDLKMFGPRIVPDNISRHFVFEKNMITDEEAGGPDWFGVQWEYIPVAGGSMVKPGNPKVKDICEWEKYITFPDLDALDWETSAKENAEYISGDIPISMTIFTGFYERLISFIDFEDAAVAMIDEDEQEAVHRLFDKLADFYCKLLEKFKKYYNPAEVQFHDDWGAQRSPFFSVATCDEMIIPYLTRVVSKAHELGIIFEMHSCGKIEPLVPLMMKAGVDFWRGQPMNDKEALAKEYGDRFTFGIEPPVLDESASDDEVLAAAKEYFDKYKDLRVVCSYRGSTDTRMRDAIYLLSREYFGR